MSLRAVLAEAAILLAFAIAGLIQREIAAARGRFHRA